MKHIHLKLFFLVLGSTSLCFAQDGTHSAGGEASGSGGSASYSVGQLTYTENTSSNGSSSEGVQKAYEIYTVGIANQNGSSEITLFPNPTDGMIWVKGMENDNPISYLVFNMEGKQLSQGRIDNSNKEINLTSFPTGTYFVNLHNQNEIIETFKIIKN